MNPGDRRLRSVLFGLVLLLEGLTYGDLLLERRLPRGHDTLSVFLLQYLFLSGPVTGAVPGLWMPGLAHGLTSAWFTDVQSGLLQNVLLLLGGVPKGTPMLPIFYAGLFFEDLLLLVGVWKLAGRLYRSPWSQFFVAVAALGSSLWITNIFWAHRLFYGVPLALALLLDFLETGSRARLLQAASLGGLLLLGNAPYIPMLTGAAILLYLAVHLFVHRKACRASLPLLRPRRLDAPVLLAVVVLFGACAAATVTDLGSLRQFHRGRNPDGSVSLDSFLTYAGGLNPLRYVDVLFGLTPSSDFALYAGLSTVLLAGLAFRRPRKDTLVVSLSFLLLLFFSLGYLNGTAMLGYALFPPFHYFRYVSLASGLVKLFLILLAGFGVDALAREARRGGSAPGAGSLRVPLAAALLLVAQWGILCSPAGSPEGILGSLFWSLRDNLAQRTAPARPLVAPAAFLFVLVTAAILAVWRLRGKSFALGIPLLLAVHGTDLLRWRLSIFREETVPLSAAEYEVQRIAPLPFIVRRSSGTEVTDRSREFDRDVFSSGVLYDYVDPFLHRDVSWSRFLVTQWSPPLDLLLRTYCGAPLETPTGIPLALVEENASSRAVPEPFARIIGESEGKLQVFSAAHPLPSDEAVARVLKRKDFQGNILLLTRPPGGPPGGIPAARNERLPAEFEVRGFSPNRLSLDVRLPPGAPEGWLVYCDSWHPAWTATVNGAPQPIERAFLAYKAVRVPAGTSSVEFRFRAPLRSIAYLGVGVQSLLWLGLLGGWSLRFLGLSRAAARL